MRAYGKISIHLFIVIHSVIQSVCLSVHICYTPASPGGARVLVIPPSDFDGGPRPLLSLVDPRITAAAVLTPLIISGLLTTHC